MGKSALALGLCKPSMGVGAGPLECIGRLDKYISVKIPSINAGYFYTIKRILSHSDTYFLVRRM